MRVPRRASPNSAESRVLRPGGTLTATTAAMSASTELTLAIKSSGASPRTTSTAAASALLILGKRCPRGVRTWRCGASDAVRTNRVWCARVWSQSRIRRVPAKNRRGQCPRVTQRRNASSWSRRTRSMLCRIEYWPTAVAFVSLLSCRNIAAIGICRPASGPADACGVERATGTGCTPPTADGCADAVGVDAQLIDGPGGGAAEAEFPDAERAALRAVEDGGRVTEWDALRNQLLGLTERGQPLVSWRAEHGTVGHKAEDALIAAALALTAGEDVDQAHRAILLRPMSEALPWLGGASVQ